MEQYHRTRRNDTVLKTLTENRIFLDLRRTQFALKFYPKQDEGREMNAVNLKSEIPTKPNPNAPKSKI